MLKEESKIEIKNDKIKTYPNKSPIEQKDLKKKNLLRNFHTIAKKYFTVFS